MKAVLSALLLSCYCVAQANAQAVILDVSGAQPGRYYYQITVASGGIITVTPIQQVVTLVKPAPSPTPTPTPDELTTRAKAIRDAATKVTSDSEREQTAAALAALYREIAGKIAAGEIKGQEQGAFFIKTATDMLLTARKANDAWIPVRSILTEQWSALAQEGANDAGYAQLLGEVATGLEASCANADPQIDMAMILQILKIVIELLEKFFP